MTEKNHSDILKYYVTQTQEHHYAMLNVKYKNQPHAVCSKSLQKYYSGIQSVSSLLSATN